LSNPQVCAALETVVVLTSAALLSKFGVDPVRYFLLRNGGIAADGDYSEQGLLQAVNS